MTRQAANIPAHGAFSSQSSRRASNPRFSRRTAYEVFRGVIGQSYEGHEDEWASALAEVGLPFDTLPAAQMLAETLNSKSPMDVIQLPQGRLGS